MKKYLEAFGAPSERTLDDTHFTWYINNYKQSAIDEEELLSRYCMQRTSLDKSDVGTTVEKDTMRVRIPRSLIKRKEAQLLKYKKLWVILLIVCCVCWGVYASLYFLFSLQ